MGVGILAKRVVLELGFQHHLCLQSERRLPEAIFFCVGALIICYFFSSEPGSWSISFSMRSFFT